MRLVQWLTQRWFKSALTTDLHILSPQYLLLVFLLPAHALFVLLSTIRSYLYQWNWLKKNTLPVPVVIVGNITVGGAGKTPLVLWLAQNLQAQGWKPGIISRGYGGSQSRSTQAIAVDARQANAAQLFGDEPTLLAQRQPSCPVWIGKKRANVGLALLDANPQVNILLCDDGLQHYNLARDLEIVVFDNRGIGNGWRLPLGPLREPITRIAQADALVTQGSPNIPLHTLAKTPAQYPMQLIPGDFYNLYNPQQQCSAHEIKKLSQGSGQTLYALAGIGNPERFFQTLIELGLDIKDHCRAFADHHQYDTIDLDFAANGILLITEKDAVKCRAILCAENHTSSAQKSIWVLPVSAQIPHGLIDLVLEKING